MPRLMPANLVTILDATARKIEYLLSIDFPSIVPLRFSTGELTKNSVDYDNRIESVSEIRQTIETPIDRVNLRLTNADFFFDAHLSANVEEWKLAEAVLYRRYSSADGSVVQDVEVFRGAVQSPHTDDSAPYAMTMQIVPDTISKGLLVANRTLALPCSFVFKDPATCGYSGPVLTCNHLLKSDCTRLLNGESFGGTESRYTNKTSTPGSAGNPETGGGNTGTDPNCPALDQLVLVVEDGATHAKSVSLIRAGDFVLNPITRTAERVKTADIVENEGLFEVICVNGATTKGSRTHPLIRSICDDTGLRIMEQETGGAVLSLISEKLRDSNIAFITPKGKGAVMRIETEGPTHIYASGATETEMIVCHNARIIKQTGNQA